jgi:hypothetical protein
MQKNKEYQFSSNSMMMDEIKNDRNQSGPTFKTCDVNHAVGTQHKKQTKKITM